MFGINLGFTSKKEKGTQTGTVLEDLNSLTTNLESQTGSKSSTGSTATNAATTSAGKSVGSTSSEQLGSTTDSKAGTTTGSQFGGDILSVLKGLLTNPGGGGAAADGFNAGAAGLRDGLAKATAQSEGFDAAAYVEGIANKAQSDQSRGIETSLGKLYSAAGGSSSGNSMAALAEARIREEGAANVGAVRADATAKAQDIVRSNTNSLATIASGNQTGLLNLGQLLKGAETSESQNLLGTSAQTGKTTGLSLQDTSETQNQLSTVTSQLQDLIAQLTSGTQAIDSSTLKTLDLKTTGSSTGFSASASAGK